MIGTEAYLPKATPANIFKCRFQEKTRYALSAKKLVESHMNCNTGLEIRAEQTHLLRKKGVTYQVILHFAS